MKKAVDVVLQYFEETALPEAEVILYMATKVVSKRMLDTPNVAVKTRKLSASGRQRIADAQKARHAAAREQTEAPKRTRKTNSAPFEHSEETKEALV